MAKRPAALLSTRKFGLVNRKLTGPACCCGGGPPGQCCDVHRLPFECAVEGVTPDNNTCCSCGTRFRRSVTVNAEYALSSLNRARFFVRVRLVMTAVMVCDSQNHYVTESFEVSTAEVSGEASQTGYSTVTMSYGRDNPPPPHSSIEQYAAAALLASECSPGIVHAASVASSLVDSAVTLLVAEVVAREPGMSWSVQTAYLSPNADRGRDRGLSLLRMNENACIFGYEPGIRCDCPRSYRYRFDGGNPPAYFYFQGCGSLRDPTITWSGSQTCRSATYGAENSGTLYDLDPITGGEVVSGAVSATALVSVATIVAEPCSPDPCDASRPAPDPDRSPARGCCHRPSGSFPSDAESCFRLGGTWTAEPCDTIGDLLEGLL